MKIDKFDKVMSLAKRRLFIFPGSGIYGGLTGIFDFGPLGVEMKNNIKKQWWKFMVTKRRNIIGIDGAIITHNRVWEASGHIQNFTDPLVEDKVTHKRFRADNLIKDWLEKHGDSNNTKVELTDMNIIDMSEFIEQNNILSPDGNPITNAKSFNLLMSTELGVTEGGKDVAYLRGEACQTIYLDYKYIIDSGRYKLPFGICQIGKAFRNEITPKHSLYRQREFEQMDLQYFVAPEEMEKSYEYWKGERENWYKMLLNDFESIRFRQQTKNELAHYAKVAFDVEYNAPFGWSELEGIHWRGDWDLSRHGQYSGNDLTYTDPETGNKFTPNIVETSVGVDRTFLFLLLDAYNEEIVNNETRVILRLHPLIAPVTVAILPLKKNENQLNISQTIFDDLTDNFNVEIDVTGSIGKRYRRQDEIGTPFAVTIDDITEDDGTVTVRDRDTMKQERVKINELTQFVQTKIKEYRKFVGN